MKSNKPPKNRNRVYNKLKKLTNSSSASNNNDDHVIYNPVEVFCRIKPISDSVPCITVQSPTQLSIISPVSMKTRKVINCKFNQIFTEKSDQKQVFDFVAKPLLKGFVQGENGLLLTYGVTGSGKTYCMCGEPNNAGIIPRCVYTLFNSIGCYQTPKFLLKSDKLNGFEQQEITDVIKDQEKEAKTRRYIRKKKNNNSWENVSILNSTQLDDINKNLTYTIFVNYVEIYNNNTYDLLDDTSGSKSLQAKILREDCNNNIYVNGVVEIEVKTAEEAIELYCIGNKRKRIGQTYLNAESSRSHSIFTIRLVTSTCTSVKEKATFLVSQLSLVDLAGSERCNRTNCSGQMLKEAGSINNSLMALRSCLEILRENKKTGISRLVPYRESRLTLLFKNYLEGEGNVKMIICVNPSAKDYDETIHVMKFAEMSQEVMVLRPIIKIIELDKTKNVSSKEYTKNDEIEFIEPEIKQAENIPIEKNTEKHLPKVRILNPECNEIQSLVLYLKRRRQMSSDMKILRNIGDQFRLRLVDLEAEKNTYEKQCKYLLPAEREKVKDLKAQLISMGYQYDQIKEKCQKQETQIEDLQMNVQDKDFKIKQNILERKYNKGVNHEIDAKLRRKKEFLTTQIKEKSDQIELINDTDKTIISNLNIDDQNIFSLNSGHVSRRDTPVANVRYRRSLSVGDSWLEHKPQNPVPINTILQPVFNCKKTVTNLINVKDIVDTKQNKYVLISQSQDKIGDLETKLFKGEIIPTCSGGAQVIFNDVEKLKQESPISSKK